MRGRNDIGFCAAGIHIPLIDSSDESRRYLVRYRLTAGEHEHRLAALDTTSAGMAHQPPGLLTTDLPPTAFHPD
jgi:hypothetical protein